LETGTDSLSFRISTVAAFKKADFLSNFRHHPAPERIVTHVNRLIRRIISQNESFGAATPASSRIQVLMLIISF
jgi:hypothetical protein